MNKTNIEYLDYTWNPIVMRCTPVSEGCANCWHLATADRLAKNPQVPYEFRLIYEKGCIYATPPDRLRIPKLRRSKRLIRIGVQFMGDLFGESILFDHIFDVFQAMFLPPSYCDFFLLTKRPKRAEKFFAWETSQTGEGCSLFDNTHFGVTIENQTRADERIPTLLEILFRNRWVSLEPLLGPIRMLDHLGPDGINWVVIGPETGPKRRECKPEWIEDLVRQCDAAEVPYFIKAFPMPDGRISKNMTEWPEWARVRQYPEVHHVA